jgi:hypothetical protein
VTITLGYKEADAYVTGMSSGVEKHSEGRKVQLKDE